MATQVYSFDNGFSGGLNISVAPDQISPNQSPDIENCNLDDGGVITKRYGFTRAHSISLGPTPIRDMVDFAQIGKDDEFLVVCGGSLYKKN